MNQEKQRLADIRRRLERLRRELSAQDQAIEQLNACASDSQVLAIANALDAELASLSPKADRLTAMLA